MSIAVVFSALSLGEKKLAKYAQVATTTWLGRSVLIKLAHILERIGLAMVWGRGRPVRGRRTDAHGKRVVSKRMDGLVDDALRGLWLLCGHRSA